VGVPVGQLNSVISPRAGPPPTPISHSQRSSVETGAYIASGTTMATGRPAKGTSGPVRLMRSTGRALLFTSIVLALGFAVFALGEMRNVRVFGLLLSFASIVAFLADLLVAPALLAVVERLRRRRHAPATAVAPGAHP